MYFKLLFSLLLFCLFTFFSLFTSSLTFAQTHDYSVNNICFNTSSNVLGFDITSAPSGDIFNDELHPSIDK